MKRIIAVISALAVIFTLVAAQNVFAAGKKLLVLGDSIATGYGLEDYNAEKSPKSKFSWAYLLGGQIGYTKTNLAQDGCTIEQLSQYLKTSDYIKAVQEADIIVVSVGSNDLLELAETIKMPDVDMTNPGNMAVILGTVATAIAAVEVQLPFVLSQMESDYDELFSTITRHNIGAGVVIENLYNPVEKWDMQLQTYNGVYKIDELVRSWVTQANEVVARSAAKYGFFVADVFTEFQKDTDGKYLRAYCASTSALMSGDYNADPHPTKEGHAAIEKVYYDLIIKENLKSRVAEVPVITAPPVTTAPVTKPPVTTSPVTTAPVTTAAQTNAVTDTQAPISSDTDTQTDIISTDTFENTQNVTTDAATVTSETSGDDRTTDTVRDAETEGDNKEKSDFTTILLAVLIVAAVVVIIISTVVLISGKRKSKNF